MTRAMAMVLALLAAGCFRSERPLFDEARGACPFVTPTTLIELEKDGVEGDRFTFKTDGHLCVSTGPDGDVNRVLFVPLSDGWWILQGEEQSPIYSLMHRSGGKLMQYMPNCGDFSKARLTALGVRFDEERQNCTATDARQIETLFKSWRNPFRQPAGGFRIAGPAGADPGEAPAQSADP